VVIAITAIGSLHGLFPELGESTMANTVFVAAVAVWTVIFLLEVI
jgi:hypothetical protein